MLSPSSLVRRATSRLRPPDAEAHLGPQERRILVALAEAAMPAGRVLTGGGDVTVERVERFIDRAGKSYGAAVRGALWAAELATVPTHGRRLSRLPLDRRVRALEAWSERPSRHARWLLRGILTPIKIAHFDDASMFEHVGCRYDRDHAKAPEPARWRQQITDGRKATEDLKLECEVVVIGTGAGGAAAAYELARRGRAVLMLEWGDYHDRSRFDGRTSYAYSKMYLAGGATVALGNVGTPVWAGRAVGGSTVINSGTCYRAPSWVLDRWAERYGLGMLAGAALDPFYERVEAMLEVTEAAPEHLGGPARVVARGAAALGLSHQPLRRNAPACDGQGVCCFGCPTGAKRSTDVSYVPAALERGAQLVTAAHVLTVDVVAGRARGVTARLGSGRTLKVRAEAVVVAGGALLTPGLLERSGVARSSGWLGRNLSIHPASKVAALFDEVIDMSRGIPQSYAIDEFHREGLMFEGGSTPLEVTAAAVPWVGPRFTEVMERYRHLAQFGFMIQDHSRGRVRPGPRSTPIIFYDQSPRDTALMKKGIVVLSEVFLKAGAERVLPFVAGCDEIRTESDLDRLRALEVAPGDFEVTAFHPLGTCRMGTDPRRSCIGPDQQVHDTDSLYVCDGSAIPSSLAVNPQMTIMALALRTAEIIDDRLG